MDILSHGLWSALAARAANRKLAQEKNGSGRSAPPSPFLAGAWGVLPDLAAFAPLFLFFGYAWLMGVQVSRLPRLHEYQYLGIRPPYVFGLTEELYRITHSVVIFTIMFFLAWMLRRMFLAKDSPLRRPPYEMLAWLFHIIVDIPTHSSAFYPTPFLWPISDYRFLGGFSWGQPWFIIANYSALGLCYLLLRDAEKKK
jgi:hypothetical protein